MATEKSTRLVLNDPKNLQIYNSLSPEDFKEFMMAYLTYQPGMDMSGCFSNPYVYAIFLAKYQGNIDYNEEKWEKKAIANRENGKKGGRPRKVTTIIQPNEEFDKETGEITEIENKAPEEPLKEEDKEAIIPTIKLFKNSPKTPKETILLNETITAQDEQDNNIEIGEEIMHTEDGKIWHTDAEIRSVAAEIWKKYQMDENTDFEEFKREILPQYSQGWANIDRTRLKDFIGLGIHNCKNKEKEII